MKKKIFLISLMVALFVCVFAISVSAEVVISQNNIDENGDVVADIEYRGDGYSGYLSVSITYDDINGNQKAGKFYYKSDAALYNGMLQISGVYIPSDFDFSQIIYLFDKCDFNGDGAYTSDELLKGSNGGNGVMHWHTYTSFNSQTGAFNEATINAKPSITAISYSRYTVYFGMGFISCAMNLKTVTYNGKEAVDGTVFISPTVVEVMAQTFGGDGSDKNNTTKTPKYTRIVFEARENTVSLGQYAFCRGVVKEIVFLSGTYRFHGNSSIAFQFKEGTSDASLERIVIASGVNFGSGEISWNVGNYDVVFIGTENEYIEQNNEGKFSALKSRTDNLTYETICYVYGHTDKNDFDCTTRDVCEIAGCNHVLREANASHNQQVTADFADYFSAVTETVVCTNEGCGHKVVNTLAPIFKFDGYSIKEEETTAICASFSVNSYVLNTYCEGITVGVIGTAFEENEEKTALLNSDGTVSATAGPVIYATIASNCKKVDFKIISNDWSSYGSLELVMALYAYDGSVQYVNGADDAHLTYSTITYNQVLASQQ